MRKNKSFIEQEEGRKDMEVDLHHTEQAEMVSFCVVPSLGSQCELQNSTGRHMDHHNNLLLAQSVNFMQSHKMPSRQWRPHTFVLSPFVLVKEPWLWPHCSLHCSVMRPSFKSFALVALVQTLNCFMLHKETDRALYLAPYSLLHFWVSWFPLTCSSQTDPPSPKCPWKGNFP